MKKAKKIIYLLVLTLLVSTVLPFLATSALAADTEAQEANISAEILPDSSSVEIDNGEGKIQGSQFIVNSDGTISEIGKSNKKTHIKKHLKNLGQSIYDKAKGFELTDKRDAYSKHFLNDDGTVTAYISGAPIHYNDGTGFQDIDLSITDTPYDQYDYSCTKNTFEAYFNKATSIKDGKLAKFILKNSQGVNRFVEYSLADAKPTSETVEDNSFKYTDIYENVDLEYILDSDRLKENIIVKAPVPAFQYKFRLNVDGADTIKREDGGIDFIDRDTGEKLWEIAPPIAEDSSDDIKKTRNVSYDLNTINENDTTYTEVTVSLNDTDFLNSATYPIIIDPTTTLTRNSGRSISSDGFAQDDSVWGYAFPGFPNGVGTAEYIVYLNFDLSSVPSSVVINSANLNIVAVGVLGSSGPGSFIVNRLTSSFANCTWYSQPGVSTNNQASLTSSGAGTKTWNLTPMIQEIKTNNYTFYGVRVKSYPPSSYSFWYDSGNYPQLVVNYTPNTAPTITPISPSNNMVYSESDTSITPSIRVYDAENNTLTCKYYIDSESTPRDTKTATSTTSSPTVTFAAFSAAALSEGTHTIKYTAYDGMATTTQNVSIKVDKNAPAITTFNTSTTQNSISITALASDSVAGLDPSPYRYTVGANVSTWGSNTSYTQSSLTPDATYTVKVEARDAKGHIATSTKNETTNAVAPSLAVSNPTSTTLKLTVTDTNPSTTQYQIISGSNYVTSTGTLSSTASWITLSDKTIIVTGLTPNTTYTFQIKARNSAGVETVLSTSVQGITSADLPAIPTNVAATATSNMITVTWDPVEGSTGYYVEEFNFLSSC